MHSVDIRCHGNLEQTVNGKTFDIDDIACMTIENGIIRDVVLKNIWERTDFLSWLKDSEWGNFEKIFHTEELIGHYKESRGIR
jgi:hypothetical protein